MDAKKRRGFNKFLTLVFTTFKSISMDTMNYEDKQEHHPDTINLKEDAPTVANILICKPPTTDDGVKPDPRVVNIEIVFVGFEPVKVKVFFFKENNRIPLSTPETIEMKLVTGDPSPGYVFKNKEIVRFDKHHELEIGAEFEAFIYVETKNGEYARKVTVPYFQTPPIS